MRCESVWGSEFPAGTQRAGRESAAKAFDFEACLYDVDFRRVALGSSDHLDGAGFFRGTTFAPGCSSVVSNRPVRKEEEKL